MSPHTDAGALLPCPFCGGEADFYENWVDHERKWSVSCGDCNANLDVCEDTKTEAAPHWNARTGDPAQASGEPLAWLDGRTVGLSWQNRIIASNPQYVENNGPENFIALYPSPPSEAASPVWWRWRFKTQGHWSKWIALENDDVPPFRELQGHHLESGHCELQPLYSVSSATGSAQAAANCDCGFSAEVCRTNPCMRKKMATSGLNPEEKYPDCGTPSVPSAHRGGGK